MIDILPKIHDRNTLEFKVGYKAPDGTAYHDFEMNTWIFIPETLDVNKHTYQKENFYRDILSYIRLITPYYQLEELASTSSLPYQRLSNACLSLTPQSSEKEKEQENYEREIKMFASIFKSSIRDTFRAALSSPPDKSGAVQENAGEYCPDLHELPFVGRADGKERHSP